MNLNLTKVVSASDIKNNFGAVIRQMKEGDYREVIVENHGEPTVAIIDIEELVMVRDMREKKKQSEALDMLRQARFEVQSRIKRLKNTKDEAALVDHLSYEVVDELRKKGELRFERDESTS